MRISQWLMLALATLACVGFAAAQGQKPRSPGEQASEAPVLPDDPRLIALHKEFVTKAEKLASDYEKADDPEMARVVYQQILRLLPQYPNAAEALARLDEQLATSNRRTMDVLATKEWQDTGIEVKAGAPLRFATKGTWRFRLDYQVDAGGIEIPPELRDFKLGSLVGIIEGDDPQKAKPFLVGASMRMLAPESGRLYLRMYDSDPKDNQGKIAVEIMGDFEQKKAEKE